MKPILLIKFDVKIPVGKPHLTVGQKIDMIEGAYKDRVPDYHVLAIPVKSVEVPFLDVSVLNAEHVKEVDFEQFKKQVREDLMEMYSLQE